MSGPAAIALMLVARRAPAFIKDAAYFKPVFGSVEIDRAHPLAFGLVEAWNLDEGGGPLHGLVNPAVSTAPLSSGGSWTNSTRGAAVKTDATTDIAEVPDNAVYDLNGDITVLVGFEWSGLTTGTWGIFTKRRNDLTGPFQLCYDNSNFQFNWGNAGTLYQQNGGHPSAARFFELSGTRIGTTATIYFDGVSQGSTVQAATSSSNNSPVAFGLFQSNTAALFLPSTERIGYARIWKYGLSASLLQEHAARPFGIVREKVARRYFTPQTTPPVVTTTPTRTLMGVGP